MEAFQGDENAPLSSAQASHFSAKIPRSLAVEDVPSHSAGPAASGNEEPAEGYIPPSPRDVGLTSRDLGDQSPLTTHGIQTGGPSDNAPPTPRSRQTKSHFEEDQPGESAADSSRDASFAQKAKEEASDTALEEAVDYNKKFGP